MKRIVLMLLLLILSLSLCACSDEWTDKDISRAQKVEIIKYNTENRQVTVTYTITDAQTVRELSDTFSNLELEDTHITKTNKWSFYVSFSGGGEYASLFVIDGHSAIKSGRDWYEVTNIDINRYLNEVIESAPSKITRDPDENHWVTIQEPSDTKSFHSDDAPPVFVWNHVKGYPSRSYVLEIDYLNDGSYMSHITSALSCQLSAEDWETIKAAAPVVDGVQTIKWRIRIDPVYHDDLDPYYTDWVSFFIESEQ